MVNKAPGSTATKRSSLQRGGESAEVYRKKKKKKKKKKNAGYRIISVNIFRRNAPFYKRKLLTIDK